MAGARSRHAVLSLTTKFRLAHEGMADMEYLSRGSAFLLNTTAGAHSARMGPAVTGSDLVVLTCQHVACPWLFPKYFADKWDWLQHVSEEFVQHSLQLLELPSVQVVSSSGHQYQYQQQELFVPKVLEEIPLQRHVWLHPSRDLAMLSLGESLADIDWEKHANITSDESPNINKWDLELLSLVDPSRSCASGDVVLFTGHKQFSFDPETATSASDAQDGVGQFPKEVLGRFVGASSQGQAFAWSEEVLEEGMCGGAVVNAEGDCVGLIEGIVPPFVEDQQGPSLEDQQQDDLATKMRKALADHVAFIPASEIAAFLIEKGPQLSTGTLLGLDDNDDDDDLW
ncbi:hypothetical protein Gpo141_00004899 [Globisporangium polare]